MVTSLWCTPTASRERIALWRSLYAGFMLTLVRPGLRALLRGVEKRRRRLMTVMLVAALASGRGNRNGSDPSVVRNLLLGCDIRRDLGQDDLNARIEPLTVTLFLPLSSRSRDSPRTEHLHADVIRGSRRAAIILAAASARQDRGPLLIGRRLGFTSREAMAWPQLTPGLGRWWCSKFGLERRHPAAPLFHHDSADGVDAKARRRRCCASRLSSGGAGGERYARMRCSESLHIAHTIMTSIAVTDRPGGAMSGKARGPVKNPRRPPETNWLTRTSDGHRISRALRSGHH